MDSDGEMKERMQRASWIGIGTGTKDGCLVGD